MNHAAQQHALRTKNEVSYSGYAEAIENDAHEPGTCRVNCGDSIPDENADAFGVCTDVEGYTDGGNWCTVYEGLLEPDVLDRLSGEALPTAAVPAEYRTEEDSEAGATRDLDDLKIQEAVGLVESVEAIADGLPGPGQSCWNCAEFNLDENGDSWGASAAVDGYVAPEQWCALWESVTAEF